MAQTPPPFETQAPKVKSGASPWLWIIIAVVGFCCIAIIAGAFMMRGVFGQVSSTAQCMITFQLANQSLIDYADANDGKFPPAATWQNDLRENYRKNYAKMESEMKGNSLAESFLPASPDSDWSCKWGDISTGMSYNSELAGKNKKDFENLSEVVTFFEVAKPGRNLAENYVKQPDASKPRMFGQPREWIVWRYSGNPDPLDENGTQIKVNTGR